MLVPPGFSATRFLLTVAAAGLGGTLFHALGLPAGWLSGATVAVAVLALAGHAERMPTRLRDLAFFLLGASMGAGVTPETLARLGDWPLSLALLGVTVVAVTAAGALLLARVGGWDAETAFFAAVPGALSTVLAVAAQSKADLGRVAVVQSIRLVALVALLPALLSLAVVVPPATGVPALATADLALLLALSALGSALFVAVRFPSGLLTGAFVASAVAHGAGWVTGTLPEALLVFGFLAVGMVIGERFVGMSLAELGRAAGLGFATLGVGVVVALVGAGLVVATTDVVLAAALLAFAPGAVEAMTVLAFAFGVDPAYVAALQLARFAAIALLVPLIGRRIGSR